MPVLTILGLGGPADSTGGRITMLAQVRAQVNRAVMLAQMQTGRPVHRVALSATLMVHQPTMTPLPSLPPVPAGGITHAPARAFIVQHGGLPVETISYTLGNARGDSGAKDRPTFSAELQGKVDVSGSFGVVVTARSLTGEGDYAQGYGPFTKVGATYTQTPTGWKTSLSSADTSAADAAIEQYETIIPGEYLIWEREKDLTNAQQAAKARKDALKARTLKDVKCPVKNPPKRRHQTVQSLIYWVLRYVPGKWLITDPLPFAGDYFWESEDTGVAFNNGGLTGVDYPGLPTIGGRLVGVSYQVKGKKPTDVLNDILGRVGWQLKYKGGVLMIGRPPKLSANKAETAGELAVPLDMLTEVKIEMVNTDQASANFSTPRWFDVGIATAQFYLAPLPPDPSTEPKDGDQGESDFEKNAGGVLEGTATTYREVPKVGTLADSFTKWGKTKSGGLLISEYETTSGWVPIRQPDGSLSEQGIEVEGVYSVFAPKVRWYTGRDQRVTTYQYGDPVYPTALTVQTSVTRSYIPELDRVDEVERTVTTQDWHPQGWLRRKTTIKRTLGEIHKDTDKDNPDVVIVSQLVGNERETESWIPLGGGMWKHGIVRFSDSYQTIVENGEIVQPSRSIKQDILVDDVTDQGPPVASAPSDGKNGEKPCPEDKPEGFGYRQQVQVRVPTTGRGDPVTIDVPWAQTIDVAWVQNVLAANRQRPARRTTYQMPVPPRVKVGGVVQSYSISGSAGSCKATVTVDEELEVN